MWFLYIILKFPRFEEGAIWIYLLLSFLQSSHLYYQLHSKSFSDHIDIEKSGSTFFGITQAAVGQYRVVLPPMPEQRAIARALSDVDALITSLDKLIAKKQLIKKAAMQQLLTGKTRLPGFSGEWKTKNMGELGNFFKGKGLPKEDLIDSGKTPAIPYTAIYTDFNEIVNKSIIRDFTSSTDTIYINSPHLLIAGSSNMLENIGKTCSYDDYEVVAIGGDVIVYQSDADVRFISYLNPLQKPEL
jgi:type I restriction enzyme, S subunit